MGNVHYPAFILAEDTLPGVLGIVALVVELILVVVAFALVAAIFRIRKATEAAAKTADQSQYVLAKINQQLTEMNESLRQGRASPPPSPPGLGRR